MALGKLFFDQDWLKSQEQAAATQATAASRAIRQPGCE